MFNNNDADVSRRNSVEPHRESVPPDNSVFYREQPQTILGNPKPVRSYPQMPRESLVLIPIVGFIIARDRDDFFEGFGVKAHSHPIAFRACDIDFIEDHFLLFGA